MVNPSIKMYARMLVEIAEQSAGRRENVRLLLSHLRQRRKLGWLSRIVREARKLARIRERERTIVFEAAKSLPKGDAFLKIIEGRGGEVVIKPELIAGAVIRQGDRRIDASVKADLTKLRAGFLQK